MPPKRAKKATNSQTKRAIADTQAGVEQATQQAARQQDTQSDADDAETQVDADPQPDPEIHSSDQHDSSNPNVAHDAMASTADDAVGATPDTEISTDDEGDDEPEVAQKKEATANKKDAATDKKDDGTEEKKKRKKRKTDPTNFMPYIHKVQKQMHPDSSMSKIAMQIMNDFIKDICTRIAETACSLCKKQKKATLQAHDIQCATKLIIGGQLSKHTETEGKKALRTFSGNTGHNYR